MGFNSAFKGLISTCEPSYVISINYRLSLPDDRSYVIGNMLQLFVMCVSLDFYTTQILTSRTVSIECISWLIKVTSNNDAQWKSEINVSVLSRRLQGLVGFKEILVSTP